MGEGKSSTIAPLLTLMLLEYNNNKDIVKPIIHIMPESLVYQSYTKDFNNIFFFLDRKLLQKIDNSAFFEPKNIFDKPITIISDYLIKLSKILTIEESFYSGYERLKYNINISNSFLIFDEVDDIADPLKSQFNKIDKFTNYEKIENEKIVCKFIFNFIYNLYFSNSGKEIRAELEKYSFKSNPLFLDSDILDKEASTLLLKYYKKMR